MVKRHVLVLLLAVLVLLFTQGCQKSEPPAPAVAAKPAPPPPPPPPPDTSRGKLVRVERADRTTVWVSYLSLRARGGVATEPAEKKAGKGKTFVILHFEGKSSGQRSRAWLTDGADKRFAEGYEYSAQKESRQIAYEVPAEATGLVWHDADKAYRLEPEIVAIQAEAGPAQPSAK